MIWRKAVWNPLRFTAIAGFLLCQSLLLVPDVQAQVVTGTLLGTVHDPSGQVLPNVQVVATLVDRNLQRSTETNETGAYELGFLPSGKYRITATYAGFKSQAQENVELRVDQRLRIDFTLQVGAVSDQITVTGEVPLVNSDSSNIGETVEQRRVAELPMRGRQFIDLVVLSAGSTPEVAGAFGGQFALAGTSVNVNGNRADANNFLLDGVPINDSMWGRMAVSPSLDAIEEMKVQSFLYTAEFGSAGGGQINITMRSGQNTLHGSLFGFFRRDQFDAKNYFASRKPPLERNNYGFSLGGPIIRSKTFFFVNLERQTATQGITLISSLPTQALRTGDFTGFAPVVDPVTKLPFPNNKIPDNRIDVISKAVLALLPVPPGAGISNNFSGVDNSHGRSTQGNLRMDHQLSASDSLSGHLNISDILGQDPVAGSPPGFAPIITLKTKTLGAQWTHVLSSTAINQFRFGYTRSASVTLTANPNLDFATKAGIQGTSHDSRVLGVPRITITGFSAIGDTVSTLSGETGDYHFIDDFSHGIGSHSLKTGVTLSRLKPSPFFAVTPRGNFSYLGPYTGNAMADFLLGLPTTASVGVGDPLVNGRAWRLGAYVQDDWRVTSHLTLNLGVRYELLTPPTDTTNRISNLDLSNGNIIIPCDSGKPSPKANLTKFPAFTFVCNDKVDLGKGLTKTDTNNWAPRLGFAYSTANNQTVVRGGYGIFYSYPPMAVRIGTPSFSIPFFSQITATNSLTAPVTTATILTTPAAAAFAGQPFSTDYRAGRTQEWSLGVQRQLAKSSVVEINYLGSHGDGLYSQKLPNQAVLGAGSLNSRKPFPLLAANLIWSGPIGRSNYNAMQLRFEQRPWHGLSLVSHYTFSKALDTASNLLSNAANPSVPQNSRNIDAEYSRSSFDARHRFVANGLYQLPFSSSSAGLNRLVGGWELSWVLTLQSNTPFSPILPSDRSGTGGFADRPDQVGNPNNIAQRTPAQFFDIAAFRLQPGGTFGNAGRNTINGPNYKDLDLAVLKNVVISERHRLQLRVEAFNALNNVNFNIPNRNFGTAPFGTVTSARDARSMQFGAKYLF
ncbi:MAG TPA: carboxypeptidase regulatory-like domain-containing protein [Candidatus Dormibacteraeota bacterium]|nr:carboxypeptidase regulatory-like domain-containing protein [Candidatus Dormibacteraeota bacterium]